MNRTNFFFFYASENYFEHGKPGLSIQEEIYKKKASIIDSNNYVL